MPNKKTNFKRTIEEIVNDTKREYPHAVWPNWTTTQNSPKSFTSVHNEGWLISSTGCLIPVQKYVNNSDLRIVRQSLGLTENLHTRKQDLGDPSWPHELQHSSLCHRHSCCNPFHFVIEEQWKNLRRNYCRGKIQQEIIWKNEVIVIESHDCGMDPPCLAPYRNRKAQEGDLNLYKGPFSHEAVNAITLGGRFPSFIDIYDPEVKFAKAFRTAKMRKEKRRNK